MANGGVKVNGGGVQLGFWLTLMGMLIGATLWLSMRFGDLERRIDRLDMSTANRWTAEDMQIWSLQLKTLNPSLEVPCPQEVVKLHADVPEEPQ